MEFLRRILGPAPATQAPWVDELLEQMQKLSRANARLSLRVEDLEKKVEGGFSELRSHVAAPRSAELPRRDELFDTLDALDEACRATRALQPELAEGLERISRRLEQLSLRETYVRVRPHGLAPDGRLFKVAGSVAGSEVPEGLVAQVVRAAVTTLDGVVVREGEVLTSRKAP